MERERQLQNEACQDYLTGLLNRRGLQASINSLRQKDFPLALYLFDLDDLKQVNDKFGHEIGDQMLRSFGDLRGFPGPQPSRRASGSLFGRNCLKRRSGAGSCGADSSGGSGAVPGKTGE